MTFLSECEVTMADEKEKCSYLKEGGQCPYSGQVCILKTCASCWIEANADLFEKGRKTVMPLREFRELVQNQK
jgi:hypothetical protein